MPFFGIPPAHRAENPCWRAWKYVPVYLLVAGPLLTMGLAEENLSPNQPNVSITPRARRSSDPPPNIRADVKMVLIPVTVTDSMDRPVKDLPANAFRVLENNVEQKIVSFWREESPVSVGFIFDASSSMKKRIDKSIAAVRQFLETKMPGDEFFLVRFSDRPTLVTPFTSDADQISQSLSSVQPEGWTSLFDAIYLGVQQMKSAKNQRRALFILSDGGDNNSRYSESEVRRLVVESDVRIFAIGLFQRPRFLEMLSAQTGGKTYWVHNLQELPKTIEKLSEEFRSHYVLGYSSNHEENDGKFRKVTVEILRSLLAPLRITWRHGYYAPGD
jgi:Ca-activated chloride channel family protein